MPGAAWVARAQKHEVAEQLIRPAGIRLPFHEESSVLEAFHAQEPELGKTYYP
jgi:hypothetical protein